jgi:hypothetical protein
MLNSWSFSLVIPAKAGIHFCFWQNEARSKWITRRILRLALRAIGCADVRSGIPAFAVRVPFAMEPRPAPE